MIKNINMCYIYPNTLPWVQKTPFIESDIEYNFSFPLNDKSKDKFENELTLIKKLSELCEESIIKEEEFERVKEKILEKIISLL